MIPDTASLWAGVRKFEDILKKDPQAYSFAPLADLFLKLGLLDDALQVARKGCAIHAGFAAGHMALARAALENSLNAEAKRALEVVVRVTPENIEAQRLLADLYTADGEQSAALRCLGIINSLEESLPETAFSAPEQLTTAEIADDDILELTDDLIEVDAFEGSTASPFSAVPERPSLGDSYHRAEPFLMETAPPLYEQEEPSNEPPLPNVEEVTAPVVSATIAELYVSQGFPEKGIETYQMLLQGEPDNESWKRRLTELSAPAAAVEAVPSSIDVPAMSGPAKKGSTEGVLEILGGWLANIGRIRECRTKIT